jgi:Ca2+-binding RTX toxin-like protein
MSSFDDFWTAIVGSPLPEPGQSDIRAAMEIIYNSSDPQAVAIISGLQSAGRRLDFFGSSVAGYSSSASLYRITVAQTVEGTLVPVKVFNNTGHWIDEPLYKTLAHELAHLVLQKEDPPGSDLAQTPSKNLADANASADLLGDAERVANSVAAGQPGNNTQTVSYYLTYVPGKEGFPSPFDSGVSYTFGNKITGGIWTGSFATSSDQYSQPYTIDRSGFTEDDLLIGGKGNDKITGSKGNNYIYGNGGHDVPRVRGGFT